MTPILTRILTPILTRIVTLILALIVVLAGPLQASTLAYLTTLDLLKASETVVVATVENTRYEQRAGQPVTIVTLRIEETWKGQVTTKTLEIIEPGGIIGDQGLGVGGMPLFQKGDRVVAFLEKTGLDPEGRLSITNGVGGRHLVIDAAAPGAPILARPSSDANCDLGGHDTAGRTVLLEYDEMMRIEGRQGTTLDQFRAEVQGYQKALAAGGTPPLSARDAALKQAFDEALNHDPKHTRTAGGATGGDRPKAVAAPGDMAAAGNVSEHPQNLPGIVVREEDVERIVRENRERRAQAQSEAEQSHAAAWIVFLISGLAFVILTVVLRRRKA